MNLRHMEVFRAVMLTGSVRGAAQLLHVSEPAASKLLAVAEAKSGCRLFERIKGRLVATPEAQALYEEVERVWQGVERVHHLSGVLAGSQRGALYIAVSPSLATSAVPRAVARVLAQKQAVDLKVVLLTPTLLVRAIVDGDVHVGIALQCPPHPNLDVLASMPCGLVCTMAADHRLANTDVVTADDLLGERLISYPELSGIIAGELGGRTVDLELRSGPAACWFARAGVGVALVDRATVADEGLQMVWKPFRTREALPVDVVANRSRPLSGLAREFVREFEVVGKQLFAHPAAKKRR
jgi:DNA-binding transcriptional LysR family regulator